MINVTNATYADCNGLYRYEKKLSVDQAPLKPVYKHLTKDRYIFWGNRGWVIGKEKYLSTGGSFQYSKYMLNRNIYQ